MEDFPYFYLTSFPEVYGGYVSVSPQWFPGYGPDFEG